MLWRGNSKVLIFTSIIFAFVSVFYTYTIGSFLRPTIYILNERVTYQRFFIDVYIINEYIDHLIIACGFAIWLVLSLTGKARFAIIALYGTLIVTAMLLNLVMLVHISAIVSVPLMISVLLLNGRLEAKRKIFNTSIKFSVNYLAMICIALGIICTVVQIGPIFSSSIPIRDYAHEIFVLLSSNLSSVLIILLLLSFPVKLLMNELLGRVKKTKIKAIFYLSSNYGIKIQSKTTIILLVLFMLLSIALALIPHQPSINKYSQPIGVDTPYYISWVEGLKKASNPQELIREAFVIQSSGDRPLTLIFLFVIMKISHIDLFYSIEYIPVVLGPALILTTYFFTREITAKDNTVSLIASFLTAVSFQPLVGIYAGFYANWLALIVGYASLIFLFKFLRTSSKLNFVAFSVMLYILWFTHVYTWSIFVIVIGIFLLVMLKLKYYPKWNVLLLALALVTTIVFDGAKVVITGSFGGIIKDINTAARVGMGVQQFIFRWSNLIDTTQKFYGNLFSNFIIFILCLFWLFRANLKEISSTFLVIFLSIGSIPLFFGDWVVQSRVLYDIPFQIPAAIGLCYIGRKQTNGTLIILAVCTWLVGVSIRAASNFSIMSPS
jgi:hypothetical protein